MKIKRICEQCGKEFEASTTQIRKGYGKYCSQTCYGKALGGRVTRICKQCGKKFTIQTHVIKRGYGKFCSQECYFINRGAKVKRICTFCGREFEIHPSRIKYKKGLFCSMLCRRNYEKTLKIKRICKECGKEFEIYKLLVKQGKGIYCSHSCSRKGRKGFPTHHTKPEFIFEDICKRNNLDFHYTGDGSLWIGKDKKLNPDFIEANGKKICVEVMGAYWHSRLLNRNLREDAMLSYRKKHYRRYKWQPIFIWDTDLLRKDAEQFVLNTLQKEGVI